MNARCRTSEQQPQLSHEGMMAVFSLLNRINAKYIFPSEPCNDMRMRCTDIPKRLFRYLDGS